MKTVKYYYSAPVHVRHIPVLTDDEGNVLFVYDKVEPMVKRVPRITVASVYDPVENKMTFGAAVCSPKDTFKKSIGREIAEKRARQFPEITVVGMIAASAQVGVNVKMVERSATHDSQRSADWADDVAKCASTATIGHP